VTHPLDPLSPDEVRAAAATDSMDTSDQAILAAVAEEAGAMEALLGDLVRARTVFGAEAAGQDVMRRAFAGLGLQPIDVPFDPDALRASPAASPFSWDVDGKASVIARVPPAGTGGRSLILNGHVDVVSAAPESLWTVAPWEPARDASGEWLSGRGAGDMKAGLAAIVGAVAGLRRLGLAPCAPVELQSVVEEECTGNGAAACVIAGSRADAAILTEPTALQIWNAQVGVLWFSLRVAGRPAHAAYATTGENAIEATYPVIRALRGLEAELNAHPPPPFDAVEHPINLNVGTIRGGDWPSTVAGECVTECRLALYPGEKVDDLRRRVEATVAAARAEGTFDVELRYDGFACEGYELPGGPLIDALGDAAARATGGERPRLEASTATTDARTFVLYGDTPAVCFGPRAESIHSMDERVHLPSMVQTAQALALFVRDWCGLADAPAPRT
jgi:acetylornithine deacetylase